MSQNTSPYEPPANPAADSGHGAPSAAPRRKWKLLLAVGGVLLLAPCVCCGGISALIGRNIYLAATEREAIQQELHQFMTHMENKQIPSAYALFSARAQGLVPRSQLQDAVNGPMYAHYEDYEQISITFVNVTSTVDSNRSKPQGTVASVRGTVSYAGGVQGTFGATLEREEGQWRLHVINVAKNGS